MRHFDTIEALRQALHAFKETYNHTWIVERHGYQTPAAVRAANSHRSPPPHDSATRCLITGDRYSRESVVEVHCDEGVASHIGPEPCAGVREGGGEASVGVRMGQPLSRERTAVSGADAVLKAEGQVARALRSLKTVDLEVRPVHHRLARRVRAHVLCLLAYHVQWHMLQALAPLLFDDHDRPAAAAARTSPVAKARVSAAARAKAERKRTADGQPVPSWRTLLADLATQTRTTVRFGEAPPTPILSTPTPIQERAFDLLGLRPQP